MDALASRIVSGIALAAVSFSSVASCGQVLDVGSNHGTEGPNASRPSKGDVPPEDGWYPSSACTPVGTTVKLLNQPGAAADVQALVPDGDTLWLDVVDFSAQTSSGRLAHISVESASSVEPAITMWHPLDGYRSLAGVFRERLVYVRVTHQGDGTKSDPRIEEVVLGDPYGVDAHPLPNPGATTYVSSVSVHASGVYWLSREWDALTPEWISRWDSASAHGLANIANYSSVITDGADIFYTRFDQQGTPNEFRFEAVSTSGGPARILRRMTYDGTRTYQIVAVDDVDVYFTEESVSDSNVGAGDLRAVKKDGTGERLLVSGLQFSDRTFHIDPDFIMWLDRDSQRTIVRIPRKGGAVERIVPGAANRSVHALASDRCNIYWAVGNPPAIYARSRLP